jgi:hypothetical protein
MLARAAAFADRHGVSADGRAATRAADEILALMEEESS